MIAKKILQLHAIAMNLQCFILLYRASPFQSIIQAHVTCFEDDTHAHATYSDCLRPELPEDFMGRTLDVWQDAQSKNGAISLYQRYQ